MLHRRRNLARTPGERMAALGLSFAVLPFTGYLSDRYLKPRGILRYLVPALASTALAHAAISMYKNKKYNS